MGNPTQNEGKPDGYWHGRITISFIPLGFLLGLVVAAIFGLYKPEITPNIVACGLVCAFGTLCGLILEPDLDQIIISSSEMRVINSFQPISWIYGGWWVGHWLSYAKAIPHRSPLSHWPVLGTTIRVAWFLCWPGWLLAYYLLKDYQPSFTINPILLLCWYLGLVVSDIGHFGRDKWKWQW